MSLRMRIFRLVRDLKGDVSDALFRRKWHRADRSWVRIMDRVTGALKPAGDWARS